MRLQGRCRTVSRTNHNTSESKAIFYALHAGKILKASLEVFKANPL
jgi:hypothetical protein